MFSNIWLGIGAAVIVIIAAVIVWLSLSNAHLKTELAMAESNNAACRVINADFKAVVDKQNASVQAMQDEAAARIARAETALKAAKVLADHYAAHAKALMRHKPDGDDCQAAKGLFDDYVQQQ